MEWLNYAGVAAVAAFLGGVVSAVLQRQTAHETSTVQTKQIEVNADEVNIKQQDASTKLLQAVSGVYDTLVKGLEDRVAASEHAEADCRHHLTELQAQLNADTARWEQQIKATEEHFRTEIAGIHEMYRRGRRRDDAD